MWIECVPNFSEGRDPEILKALRSAVEGSQAELLSFEADPDHHRAVMTIVGPPSAVVDAVFYAARVAVKRIDVSRRSGVHPRMGAIDVVPFVPLGETPMAVAVSSAETLGVRMADELGVPVYLYEHAARKASRRNLADVRRGQFEGLEARMAHDPPDFGPHAPHPTAGAVAVGARHFLIAFNVFLDTQDLSRARSVAREIRESSGGLSGVKALAMDTKPSRGWVQVSMNLVDYPTTSLPEVLDAVRQCAERWGTRVVETELVGMMPMVAVEDVMRHYLQLPGFSRKKILEYQMKLGEGKA